MAPQCLNYFYFVIVFVSVVVIASIYFMLLLFSGICKARVANVIFCVALTCFSVDCIDV